MRLPTDTAGLQTRRPLLRVELLRDVDLGGPACREQTGESRDGADADLVVLSAAIPARSVVGLRPRRPPPSVIDGNSAHNFFQRVAPTDRDRYSFETQAAIETELIVDKELGMVEEATLG